MIKVLLDSGHIASSHLFCFVFPLSIFCVHMDRNVGEERFLRKVISIKGKGCVSRRGKRDFRLRSHYISYHQRSLDRPKATQEAPSQAEHFII